MPFGRKSPLEALALPGIILAYKYSQFRQRRREAASRRVTERELSALHHKIDKLLNKLDESEPEPPTSQEDECVICINARATMQTSPCGHKVVCRRCFVKTIQSAVAQRLLPLRCVICRARVNRLTSTSGSWKLQESASSYSVGAKSWSPSLRAESSNASKNRPVPQSASLYSIGNELQGPHHRHNYNRVPQSASCYSVGSMQSGNSTLSSSSNATTCSKTSSASASSDIDSEMSSGSSTNSLCHKYRSHLCHNNGRTCSNGCSGAIPRNPSISAQNRITHSNLRRYTKDRISDLQQNRLPPIKEFRSPAKISHPSPVDNNNLRFRYSSYTKSSTSHENVTLLNISSPDKLNKSILNKKPSALAVSIPSTSKGKLGLTAKVNPAVSKLPIQRNSLSSSNPNNNTNKNITVKSKTELCYPSSSKTFSFINSNSKTKATNSINNVNNNSNSNFNSRNKFFNYHHDEKAENKKNENTEQKKKEDKLKLKAEKEAKKEEKRLAKEEERLAKILEKEDKKRSKRESKELLLAHDDNKKKY